VRSRQPLEEQRRDSQEREEPHRVREVVTSTPRTERWILLQRLQHQRTAAPASPATAMLASIAVKTTRPKIGEPFQ